MTTQWKILYQPIDFKGGGGGGKHQNDYILPSSAPTPTSVKLGWLNISFTFHTHTGKVVNGPQRANNQVSK